MIEISGLRKSYGKKRVIDGVDLSAAPGQQIALIGRNGCGKTTLLSILAGIIKPDSGTFAYFGHDCIRDKKAIGTYCGYLPQADPLIPELNVQDNISLWSGYRGRPDEEIVSFLDLGDILKTPVNRLSGGMRRRVGIACAIVNWPPILLMDEPSESLDVFYKKDLREFMADYRKRNAILIIATHDGDEIEMSDRCYVLADGVLEERKYEDGISF